MSQQSQYQEGMPQHPEYQEGMPQHPEEGGFNTRKGCLSSRMAALLSKNEKKKFFHLLLCELPPEGVAQI